VRRNGGEQVDFEPHHLVGHALRVDVITAIARRTASTRLSLTTGRVEILSSSAASVRAVSDTSMFETALLVSVLRSPEAASRERETEALPPTCTGRPSIPLILLAITQSPGIYEPINGFAIRNFRVADAYLTHVRT
jgi:hypothetical protein